MRRIVIILFYCSLLGFADLQTSPQSSIMGLPECVTIKSIRQTVLDHNKFLFEGMVELILDHRLHVWAEHVEYDHVARTLLAHAGVGDFLLVEEEDFLLCAKSLFINLVTGEAKAEEGIIHLREGFATAGEVVRDQKGEWNITKTTYTSCDCAQPHWIIGAQSARLNNTFFDAKNMVFRLGSVPMFALPRFIFPVQKRAKSGLLMPKIAFDYEHGPAWNQEYYLFFNEHADATLGLDWKHNRGLFFTQKLRWAGALDKTAYFNGYYGFEENGFTQRQEDIVPFRLKERYWFQGNYFYAQAPLDLLTQLDWGTDKKMSYQFFDRLEEVDDHFYDAVVARLYGQDMMLDVRADYVKTSRKRFGFVLLPPDLTKGGLRQEPKQKFMQELDNQVGVAHLPRIELNSLYKYFGGNLAYRNDIFLDQVLLRELETEKFFRQSKLAQQERSIPLTTADVWRFEYAGCLEQYAVLRGVALNLTFGPHLSVRSRLANSDKFFRRNAYEARVFAEGASRVFCQAGGSVIFPEACVYAADGYTHYFQPSIAWSLIPAIHQKHWFYADEWDRFYPKNQLEFFLRNNWEFGDTSLDCYMAQGYDFYKQRGRFYLQRGMETEHLLPTNLHVDIEHSPLLAVVDLDVDSSSGTILQGGGSFVWQWSRMSCSMGYLYQNMRANEEKRLLSNVPHFFSCLLTIPLNRYASLEAGGNFYAEKGPGITLRPLVYHLKFVYRGHCWGFYLGFEEKRYREYGQLQREPSLVFSLQFDSLGSFAKKFKTPYQTTA